MQLEKKVISAYTRMMRALANETRLSILYALRYKQKLWTELLFELEINPKSLRDHLAYLRKSGLVRKSEPAGFELTEAARAFLELSLEEIMSTAKQAARIAKTS